MNNPDALQFFQDIFQDEFLSKAFLLSIITGAITAIIVYGRQVVTFFYQRIRRLVVFSVRIEQTDELFWMLESWLYHNYDRKYRNVICFLNRVGDDGRPKEKSEVEESQNKNKKAAPPKINFRQNEDFIIIKYRYGWIKIRKGRDKLENASSLNSLFFDSFVLTSLFGTRNMKTLLKEVVELDYKERVQKQVNYIYVSDGGGYWNKKGTIAGKDIKNIFIPDKDKINILDDINRFLDSRKWHEDKGIPYKRGYLFHGAPGNGKTSLALSLAKVTKRDMYILNLSSLYGDADLIRSFTNIPRDAILLIEDIDIVFKAKRKMDAKLSFSTLLNCLDGAFYRDGVITIMTTNCMDKLDDALIRDGRADVKLLIDYPSSDLMRDYVNNFFETKIYLNGEVLPTMNVAQLQNLCLASNVDTIKKKLRVVGKKEQILSK